MSVENEQHPGPPPPAQSPSVGWWQVESTDGFALWPATATSAPLPGPPPAPPTGDEAEHTTAAQPPGALRADSVRAVARAVATAVPKVAPGVPDDPGSKASPAPPIVGRFSTGRLGLGTLRRPTPRAPLRGGPRHLPRHPAIGLPALVLFALFSGFFSWVSAEPFWLAVGHGEAGTATVTRCEGSGVTRRCFADFDAGSAKAERVTLAGVDGHPGRSYQARMVDASGRIAYAGNPDALHPRWIIGLAMVLLCGLGIVWGTGAARLGRRRAGSVALSFAGPLGIFAGMLLATL